MEEKQRKPIIRQIYLYLFTILGLVLLTIGSVGFMEMALKTFIFTEADAQQRTYAMQPPMPYGIDTATKLEQNASINLTDAQRAALDNWINDYNTWKAQNDKVDPVTADRHRSAATNLAFIIVGLPLYLYHWKTIKKEASQVI